MISPLIFDILTEKGTRITVSSQFPRHLFIDGRSVVSNLQEDIVTVAVSRYVIVITTDPSAKTCPCNNVLAISLTGERLWCIKDLIPHLKKSLCSGHVVGLADIPTMQLMFNRELYPSHEYYVCFDNHEQRYLIDLTEKKLISQIGYKM